jgi:hypothetical protein
MKLLIALTSALVVLAPATFAGDKCCDQAKASATVCEKGKEACCESAKAECPVAKAALRKTLTTHKGAQLARR